MRCPFSRALIQIRITDWQDVYKHAARIEKESTVAGA